VITIATLVAEVQGGAFVFDRTNVVFGSRNCALGSSLAHVD
jgi:hypothetical protein